MNIKHSIDYSGFPSSLKADDKRRATLILEGHWLRAQQQHGAAADLFAEAAELEQPIIEWAQANEKHDFAYIHILSQVSLWAQAGNPRQALKLIDKYRQNSVLSAFQLEELQKYHATLQEQLAIWLDQWAMQSIPV